MTGFSLLSLCFRSERVDVVSVFLDLVGRVVDVVVGRVK